MEILCPQRDVARPTLWREKTIVGRRSAIRVFGHYVILFGDGMLRRAVTEYVAHYHGERNHQGLGNDLIDGPPTQARVGRVRRYPCLGGLLNYYARAA